MRILIDGRFFGLENAGIGRYTMNLVEQLAKIDNTNEYVILLRKKYYSKLHFPSKWKKILVDIPHYSLKEQFLLSKKISEQQPDLVHFLHFNVPVNYKGSFIVTIHDLLMHRQKGKDASTLPLFIYFFKRFGYFTNFKKAVRDSKKIIVPSNYVKEDVLRHYKIDSSKVSVVYEGVTIASKSNVGRKSILEKYKVREPYFIYTGNAYPHKNLKRAIEAVTELNRQQQKQVMLAIVSSRNIFTKRLERIIAELDAIDSVKLLGYVPDKDLNWLYKNSVGYLFPSIEEGFGLPGLEALSSGTLLLASEIPVFKEIYKNHAIYFNPYDFSSIQKTLKLALELEEEKRLEKIDLGKAFTKNYSWYKMAQQTLRLYESCVSLRQS